MTVNYAVFCCLRVVCFAVKLLLDDHAEVELHATLATIAVLPVVFPIIAQRISTDISGAISGGIVVLETIRFSVPAGSVKINDSVTLVEPLFDFFFKKRSFCTLDAPWPIS